LASMTRKIQRRMFFEEHGRFGCGRRRGRKRIGDFIKCLSNIVKKKPEVKSVARKRTKIAQRQRARAMEG
jgi:hypothetical protein